MQVCKSIQETGNYAYSLGEGELGFSPSVEIDGTGSSFFGLAAAAAVISFEELGSIEDDKDAAAVSTDDAEAMAIAIVSGTGSFFVDRSITSDSQSLFIWCITPVSIKLI